MSATHNKRITKPWYKRIWLWIILVVVIISGAGSFFIYGNFNSLLTQALHKAFEQSIVSDVYELKFENLRVNVLAGDIKVSDVVFQKLETPLEKYPYINSSIRLTTNNLTLKNVKLYQLLESQTLELDKIEIDKPEVILTINGEKSVLFPFKDSTFVRSSTQTGTKKTIDAFYLEQFKLIKASCQVTNLYKHQQLTINGFSLALNNLYLSQYFGIDSLSCKSIELNIDSVAAKFPGSGLNKIDLNNFLFNVDDVDIRNSVDTVIFHFNDFDNLLSNLEIQTADSLFTIRVRHFNLHYRQKALRLEGVSLKQNISEEAMTQRFPYEHQQFTMTTGMIEMVQVDFDSLLYQRKLIVDELILDSVSARLFKDKTRPVDFKRYPLYPGQSITAIDFPIQIKKVVVKNSSIINRERKPDGVYAKVTVNSLNATATNFNTMDSAGALIVAGEAVLENNAGFSIKLEFDYDKPQFKIDARVRRFNLTTLNPILNSYTPAKVNSGILDELTFTAIAYKTKSSGTLKFLYHNLNIDLQLEEKAKWKNTLGALAANTYLSASNPVAADIPPKIVKFEAVRNMHKSFVNIVLKSLFSGIRETLILSKENRKAYNLKKKEWKEKSKQ